MNTKAELGSVINWQNSIWEADLPANAKLLACYLRSFMNSCRDFAYPSYARIIKATGLARATIAKYMGVLEKFGWIRREKGHQSRSTRYFIAFPDDPSKAAEIAIEAANKGSSPAELPDSLANERSSIGSSPPELGSSRDELGVVRQVNPNKQCNKQRNKQLNTQEEQRLVKTSPEPSVSIKSTFSDQDLALADRLHQSILITAPMAGKPDLEKWASTIYLMRQKKALSHQEIIEVFQWANRDNFWKGIIISPDKLQKHFVTLHAKMLSERQCGRSIGGMLGTDISDLLMPVSKPISEHDVTDVLTFMSQNTHKVGHTTELQ